MTRAAATAVRRPTVPRPLPVQHYVHSAGSSWPSLWWIGCHGGAGTSTLARVTGLGVDAGRAWPTSNPQWPTTQVVLVCRTTASGTWAATGAVEQWRRQACPPGTKVLGLVAVEASPRRAPRIALERLRLLSGWLPEVWRVGWVQAYLAVEDPLDIGIPPTVAAVRAHVGQLAGVMAQ